MGRSLREEPPWEHQVPLYPNIFEDLWFGTYWVKDPLDAMHGPINSLPEAAAECERLWRQ